MADTDRLRRILEMLLLTRRIAEAEGEDMLAYLIDMACVEASDRLLEARRARDEK